MSLVRRTCTPATHYLQPSHLPRLSPPLRALPSHPDDPAPPRRWDGLNMTISSTFQESGSGASTHSLTLPLPHTRFQFLGLFSYLPLKLVPQTPPSTDSPPKTAELPIPPPGKNRAYIPYISQSRSSSFWDYHPSPVAFAILGSVLVGIQTYIQ